MPPTARDKSDAPADSLAGPLAESDLVGHDSAERTLFEAWSAGRLHHAWLIGGPEGIGKATIAVRFARFLLTRGVAGGALAAADSGPSLFGEFAPSAPAASGPPQSLYVAPDDPVFARVRARGHADFFPIAREFDDKRNRWRKVITVDAVRDIRAFVSLTPAEGGYRVVLIDGAEDMNKNAANALLKVLEEPPPRTLFLLVTHAPGSLLPTIRSRCRTLTLRPLADADVATLLRRLRPDLPADETAALLRLADGSIGRALHLADGGGVALYREMLGLLARLPDLDIGAAHAFGGKLAPTASAGFDLFAELLGDWLARMVRGGATGRPAAEVMAGEAAAMARLASRRSLDQWVEVWEKIAHLFDRADRVNLDRKLVVLSVLLTLQTAARA